MDLRHLYKSNKCPVCEKDLIFNHDYSDVVCKDADCKFNSNVNFDYIATLIANTNSHFARSRLTEY